jgi:uncharacterized protein YprB with RNaseH-like and TPR domain
MLNDKLDRFSDQIGRKKKNSSKSKTPSRYEKIAGYLNGELLVDPTGSYVKITTDLDETYAHGLLMIDDLIPPAPLKRCYFDWSDDFSEYDPHKLLFFDMETTGLGGSGTVAFLIGFGSITGNGFQVRQYFLPDFPDEETMLEAVRAEIGQDTIIVSYNGKAFDLPILTDRMIIQRVERNLVFAEHIDLLNTVRRLYRRRLRDCTLGNVEEKILDFYRYDDIPGYLVPSIYFDWLNTDKTDQLEGVVEHNRNDIISLFFLIFQIAGIMENPSNNISEPDDILSMAKIFERRREHQNVYELLENFDDITRSHDRYDILTLQALSYKRSGCWAEAAAMWEKIISGRSEEAFSAYIELAKYNEHKIKDFKKALGLAREALKLCPPRPGFKDDLHKRINRLNGKILKSFKSK